MDLGGVGGGRGGSGSGGEDQMWHIIALLYFL